MVAILCSLGLTPIALFTLMASSNILTATKEPPVAAAPAAKETAFDPTNAKGNALSQVKWSQSVIEKELEEEGLGLEGFNELGLSQILDSYA